MEKINKLTDEDRRLRAITFSKTYHAKNKEAGLCPCGQALPRPNRVKCDKCQAERRAWYLKNREKILASTKVRWSSDREAGIKHYGGKCVCCGESYLGFLCLDHIEGGGSRHRAEIEVSYGRGSNFYRWLRKQHYPEGIVQVLCANCNMNKGVREFCDCPKSRQPNSSAA